MEQDFFTDILAEMTMNILSRLPVVTTMSCNQRSPNSDMGHDFLTNIPPEMAMNILSSLPAVTTVSCNQTTQNSEMGQDFFTNISAEMTMNSEMGQNFLTNLPAEMTMNILLRLPVVTTMSCKCVCKSWLHLLETPEFVKSHFSKSIPCLAVFQGSESSKIYKVYEFVDELDPEYSERHCKFAFNFSLPHHELIHSSTDGLLLSIGRPNEIFICNPITRDYIKLPYPPMPSSKMHYQWDTFGFGVSKMSGQYKVVRIYNNSLYDQERIRWLTPDQLECQVYTLGTRSWRSTAPSGQVKFKLNGCTTGASLNGFFHVIVYDLEAVPWISCFDLETELFSTFSLPPGPPGDCLHYRRSLSALGDRLCLCSTSAGNVIVIWFMNSYGDEKSWTKPLIINQNPFGARVVHYPINAFKDGDILIVTEFYFQLLCFSNKTKTMGDTGLVKRYGSNSRTSVFNYTPSFLSLKTYAMEKVRSFGSKGVDPISHRESMKRKKSE